MQHLYQTHNDFNLSFQFQVGPGKHNMLKLGFITNVPRWSTFNDKIGKVTFNLRVRVKLGQTTQYVMLLCEGCQSSAQQACYLPSLSRYPFIHMGQEEQVRVKQGSCSHGKPEKAMECEWLISRPGKVMEIFLNVKSHGKVIKKWK